MPTKITSPETRLPISGGTSLPVRRSSQPWMISRLDDAGDHQRAGEAKRAHHPLRQRDLGEARDKGQRTGEQPVEDDQHAPARR